MQQSYLIHILMSKALRQKTFLAQLLLLW